MGACAQGTNTVPKDVVICLDSGQLILIVVFLVIGGLFCMAIGAGMRKK